MSGLRRAAGAAAGPVSGDQAPAPDFMPFPRGGRVFRSSRLVRRADAAPSGRLRLDALARYLQDVAEDDVADTGWQAPYEWLLRRCTVVISGYPNRGERVGLATFCSATGPRWAERTTTVSGNDGALMQAIAVWVAVDPDSGRPAELGPGFLQWYGAAASGREVSARLSLPGPPQSLTGRPWPLRASDFDAADHVGNTIHWAAAEDVISGLPWLPARAVVEYSSEILAGHEPRLATEIDHDRAVMWLLDGNRKLAAAALFR